MEMSMSMSKTSPGRRIKLRIGRFKIREVRERLAFGYLEEADVECQKGTTCVKVPKEDRMECQPEDPNSKIVTVINIYMLTCQLIYYIYTTHHCT